MSVEVLIQQSPKSLVRAVEGLLSAVMESEMFKYPLSLLVTEISD